MPHVKPCAGTAGGWVDGYVGGWAAGVHVKGHIALTRPGLQAVLCGGMSKAGSGFLLWPPAHERLRQAQHARGRSSARRRSSAQACASTITAFV